MRHTYECPVRWADMDMLQHVNNVTYVDYLQEARIDMFMAHPEFAGGEELAEGVVVVRHELDFVAPLVFRSRPVLVDAWISEIRAASFTMSYEVYDEDASGRRVYVRASSLLAPFVFATERPRRITDREREVLSRYLEPGVDRTPVAADGSSQYVFPLKVRWSDVDAYRHVNNVKYIEYFQEARLRYLMHLHREGDTFGGIVVARTDVDYRRPILFRLEPYEVDSWVSHVGRTSFVIAAEIRDRTGSVPGGEVLATSRSVLVGFDQQTQRSAPLTEDHRARLLDELGAG
ncbi:acyl-CoA thioesterase [Nocardioides pocheonensis]|uniref:Acyl-CoA thioesterase n=1 Tax=Nocardioides pocheonensis TaxID=661485 RepID=A0A3N0GMQ4_9ACTN|nr:thioesterase family protein [Nocardioides pocheonensis]RNM13744.1 acyl-CoA thioesterase [Nocardioides pocheonensis]